MPRIRRAHPGGIPSGVAARSLRAAYPLFREAGHD